MLPCDDIGVLHIVAYHTIRNGHDILNRRKKVEWEGGREKWLSLYIFFERYSYVDRLRTNEHRGYQWKL